MNLRPFWRYYGGKWRAAPRYPAPGFDTIVEPFAGAAGYALRHSQMRVILVEKYHVVAEVWRYLIGVKESEVRAIPCVDAVEDLPRCLPDGARWLVGFNLSSGIVEPKLTLSAGCRRLRAAGRDYYGWSPRARERVASQLAAIRHWRVIEGDYTAAPDVEATWFVDPPYDGAGRLYKHPASAIDFAALSQWCRTRPGQTIVCEAAGATWLPFRRLHRSQRNGLTGAATVECIWTA